MKRCSRCKIEKDESQFSRDQQNKDGLRSYCRACSRIQNVAAYHKDIQKSRERIKIHYREHREKMLSLAAKYRNSPKAKERIKKYTREYYQRREVRERSTLKEYRREYYKQDHVRAKQSEYSKLPNVRKRISEQQRKRKSADPKYRLMCTMRSYIALSLRDKNGVHRRGSLLGYNRQQLVEHLERQFLPGMTWGNYGRNGWHVDHIIPVSAFNFNGPDDYDFKRCWSLNNLQPMWAKDNISKGARVKAPFQPCLI